MLTKIREGWGLGEEFNNEGDVENSGIFWKGMAESCSGRLLRKFC